MLFLNLVHTTKKSVFSTNLISFLVLQVSTFSIIVQYNCYEIAIDSYILFLDVTLELPGFAVIQAALCESEFRCSSLSIAEKPALFLFFAS